jgi:lactate permease
MLVAVLTIFLHGMSAQAVARAWKKTAARMRSPLMALLFAVALVEIYKNSALNPLDLPSMPMTMAMGAAALAGSLWPMAAPFVGALGSFITGSNTVSNLLFSGFQYDSAVQLGLDRTLMVALQAVGGAMGNMICIHNIVAVCATVGLINREGPLVQKNALPLLLYGLAAGALGLTAARL